MPAIMPTVVPNEMLPFTLVATQLVVTVWNVIGLFTASPVTEFSVIKYPLALLAEAVKLITALMFAPE